jgi:hypothetical protein
MDAEEVNKTILVEEINPTWLEVSLKDGTSSPPARGEEVSLEKLEKNVTQMACEVHMTEL